MRAVYETSTVTASRLAFIEILSAEFLSRTGVGVYVYLTPVDINSLFKLYLSNNLTITIFVRQYVRDYSSVHNV